MAGDEEGKALEVQALQQEGEGFQGGLLDQLQEGIVDDFQETCGLERPGKSKQQNKTLGVHLAFAIQIEGLQDLIQSLLDPCLKCLEIHASEHLADVDLELRVVVLLQKSHY